MDDGQVRVGIEKNDLQQSSIAISSNNQIAICGDRCLCDRVTNRGSDVVIADSVFAGTFSDLHSVRVPCQCRYVKVPCLRGNVRYLAVRNTLPLAHIRAQITQLSLFERFAAGGDMRP